MIPLTFISTFERQDRYERMDKRIRELGITATEFRSHRDVDPIRGCRMSHIHALQAGYGPIIILEDDAEIPDDFVATVSRLYYRLPVDWDVVMLGGAVLPAPGEYALTGVPVRIQRVIGTHCYMVRGKSRQDFTAHIKMELDHLDRVITKRVVPNMNVYGFTPQLIRQAVDLQPGDIPHKNVEHLVCR